MRTRDPPQAPSRSPLRAAPSSPAAILDCGEQRVELPLVCEYEPLIDRTRCDLDAAREALIDSSREAARGAFASEYSCALAKISVVAESAQDESRRLELVGCEERASYVCVAGADGQPRCAR